MTQVSKPESTPRSIDSRELFKDGKVVIIVHDGEPYQLRLTANNRLILTK